jgi:hypothetical protein
MLKIPRGFRLVKMVSTTVIQNAWERRRSADSLIPPHWRLTVDGLGKKGAWLATIQDSLLQAGIHAASEGA